jgi:hypothetical protein
VIISLLSQCTSALTVHCYWGNNACRDRAAKDTENAIQQSHEDNHSGKAMEVLLTQAKDKGTHFCEGIPLVPTLEEVSKMQGLAAAIDAGKPARRARPDVLHDHAQGDDTFFLGKGQALRRSHGETMPAMNAVGFFLYTQCDGNTGDKWPATMGARTGSICTVLQAEF